MIRYVLIVCFVFFLSCISQLQAGYWSYSNYNGSRYTWVNDGQPPFLPKGYSSSYLYVSPSGYKFPGGLANDVACLGFPFVAGGEIDYENGYGTAGAFRNPDNPDGDTDDDGILNKDDTDNNDGPLGDLDGDGILNGEDVYPDDPTNTPPTPPVSDDVIPVAVSLDFSSMNIVSLILSILLSSVGVGVSLLVVGLLVKSLIRVNSRV